MKNISFVALFTALMFLCQGSFAHIYSFSNHTKKPLKVRIQLSGIGEPWYYLGAPPFQSKDNANAILNPNQNSEVRFVLGEGPFDYSRKLGFCLARIQMEEPGGAFREIAPVFVKTDYYNTIIDASKKFSEGALKTAAEIAKKFPGTGTLIGESADKIPIGNIVDSVGTMIGYSLCRERHFDIVEGTDGIKTMTLAQ